MRKKFPRLIYIPREPALFAISRLIIAFFCFRHQGRDGTGHLCSALYGAFRIRSGQREISQRPNSRSCIFHTSRIGSRSQLGFVSRVPPPVGVANLAAYKRLKARNKQRNVADEL